MLGTSESEAPAAIRVPFKLLRDRWGFCHNPHRSPVEIDGLHFPTAEHAYQAAKALDRSVREAIAACPSPWRVMSVCRGVDFPLRADWEDPLCLPAHPAVSRVKEAVMLFVVALKFQQNPALAAKLAELPEHAVLVEDASGHGDAWWGEVAPGVGRNALGSICTAVARALQRSSLDAVAGDPDLFCAWMGSVTR